MKINRNTLHKLLSRYEDQNTNNLFNLFQRKSKIRDDIEKLRISLAIHKSEGHSRFYAELNELETAQLISALKNFINGKNLISNMNNIDNQMIHQFMCDSLIAYELDYTNDFDAYREVVDLYFSKLNLELNLQFPVTVDQNNLTSLQIWLQHVISNPELYIGHLFINGSGNDYIFSQLNLSECGCVDVSHDRLLGNVRLQAEKLIIDQCMNAYNLSNTKSLNILSFGAGKGLQDFIVILKLLSLGVNSIELTLIESDYQSMLSPIDDIFEEIYAEYRRGNELIPERYYLSYQETLYSIIRALSILTKCFNNFNLIVNQYHTVSDLKKNIKNHKPFDVIHSIDLDDYEAQGSQAYKDFHALADCLSDDGIAILSHHQSIEQFKAEKVQTETRLKQIDTVQYPEIKPINDNSYEIKHSIKKFFV